MFSIPVKNTFMLFAWPISCVWLNFLVILTMFQCVSVTLYSQSFSSHEITLQQAIDTALANNRLLHNALLYIDEAKAQRKALFDFDPVEFSYYWGQFHSADQDRYFEIQQNFGSVLTHVRLNQKARLLYENELLKYKITEKQLCAEVKSLYHAWQYQYSVVQLKKEEAELYEQLIDIANLRYETGDISLLSKISYTTSYSDKKLQYLNALDDLAIAELKLQHVLSAKVPLTPLAQEPKLYEIQKLHDTNSLRGELVQSHYIKKYELAKTDEIIAKSKYFPEISAGYFTQEIEGQRGLFGWQVGLAVPIWFPARQSEIKQAQIASLIAQNETEYNQQLLDYEINQLIYTLNKYFRRFMFYEHEALPGAELLMNTIKAQLLNEEIDFTEFIKSVSVAVEIKKEYYSVINLYNQSAIQLEFYEN